MLGTIAYHLKHSSFYTEMASLADNSLYEAYLAQQALHSSVSDAKAQMLEASAPINPHDGLMVVYDEAMKTNPFDEHSQPVVLQDSDYWIFAKDYNPFELNFGLFATIMTKIFLYPFFFLAFLALPVLLLIDLYTVVF